MLRQHEGMINPDELGIVVDESGCDVDDLVFCGAPEITVPGTVALDDVVALCVDRGWVGLEGLSGHPGTIAEAVRSNASAHGYQIADSVNQVITWDHESGQQRTFPAAACGFRNGGSDLAELLDDGSPRFEIRNVRLLLRQGDIAAPAVASLATVLGCEIGSRQPITAVRRALSAHPQQR